MRTILVGALGSIHDPLVAAALRRSGFAAEQLPPCSDAGMRRARALGNHGQCNPAHYAVGAVLEHPRAGDAEFPDDHAWLALDSCGPCRLASFGIEWARVLGGAGIGRLPILRANDLHLARSGGALLEAIVAGDVLACHARRARPMAIDPDEVDARLASSVARVARALEQCLSVREALASCDFEGIARETRRAPRILVVGEPWTTIVDGDPSYDLVRRLGHAGAIVDAPLASDWLRYRVWQEKDTKLDRRIRAVRRAFGLPAPRDEMKELADLARPHWDPAVLGGSAHLEIGRALRAKRDNAADLVISIKPFGCLPSSHLSDGILSVLSRAGKAPPFLAVETTGTAHATVESRVEMALHAARLAAEA